MYNCAKKPIEGPQKSSEITAKIFSKTQKFLSKKTPSPKMLTKKRCFFYRQYCAGRRRLKDISVKTYFGDICL